MKKFLLLLVSLLAGILLFIWILNTVGWQGIEETFYLFFNWQGLSIILLTVLMAIIGAWKWQEVLKGFGENIPIKSLFAPYLAGQAIMFFIPVVIWGGEFLRGYSLKQNNSVSWPKGMASIIIDRIFEWTASLFIIILSVLFFISQICRLPHNLEILFGVFFFLFVVWIIFFYVKVFQKDSIIRSLAKIVGLEKLKDKNILLRTEKEIFNFFRLKNKKMWSSLLLSFLRCGVMVLRVWVLVFFLGSVIGFMPSLTILGFNYLATMVPIPTALGSHEAIQTFAFGAMGLNPASAVSFTMIIRGAEMVVSLIGVFMLFKFLTSFIKDLFFKKVDKLMTNGKNNDESE
jgi:uncharacterized protein (TIRG00374 family)